ncbi:MAG: phospholipid carrier-dependent glycosyltransferase [Patescibacteria group bacterium]|nr:phospholipid carrier-dependent glycosyltransferase [Patescibacteria group bacterium]
MKSSTTFYLFLVILGISLFFHIINISYPSKPVFDEAHFATYAAKYATHTPFFDIHPPLGKIFYALPLIFSSKKITVSDANFIEMKRNLKTDAFETTTPKKEYNNFPYISLRLVSVFFGILLSISVFAFLKALTKNNLIALLGMFLTAFDNALLLEGRLILLNIMYLSFGFFSLALFFKQKSSPILAGLIWGLALSVKLISIVFLGPVIALIILSKNQEKFDAIKKFIIFLFIGLLIFAIALLFINPNVFGTNNSLNFYKTLINDLNPDAQIIKNSFFSFLNPIASNIKVATIEFYIMLSGYTAGVPPHPSQSHWYAWPAMYKAFPYFTESINGATKTISLIGNPIIWALGLLSILFFVFRKHKTFEGFEKKTWIIFGGYLASLLPYIFISRPAFLYHYFPALIFSICLASIFVMQKIKTDEQKINGTLLTVLIAVVVIGFTIILSFTHGLYL